MTLAEQIKHDAQKRRFLRETAQAAMNGIIADHCDIECVGSRSCSESIAVYAFDYAEKMLAEWERRYGEFIE